MASISMVAVARSSGSTSARSRKIRARSAGCLSLSGYRHKDNNPAEQAIRMSKLRIKVSGCMRSMTGAQIFCALRTYLATATRHGISALDALTHAAEGDPWIPEIPALA